jgi:hypothetical protein
LKAGLVRFFWTLWWPALTVSAVLWANHPRTTAPNPSVDVTVPPNHFQWAFLTILFGGPLVLLPVLLVLRAIVDGVIGQTRRQAAKYQRDVDEVRMRNAERFCAEATARLDGYTQDGNAQRMILDELIEKYQPPIQVKNFDGSFSWFHWTVDAGWQEAEPHLMLRLHQWKGSTLHWWATNYRPIGGYP